MSEAPPRDSEHNQADFAAPFSSPIIMAPLIQALHLADDEVEDKLALLRRELNSNPNDHVLLCSLAQLYFSQNQVQAAVDALYRALQVKPGYLDSLQLAVSLFRQLGNMPLVYNSLKKIQQIKPALRPDLEEEIFVCLEGFRDIDSVHNIAELSVDLIHYREQPHVDGTKVNALCRKIISSRYHSASDEDSAPAEVQLAEIARDELFMQCLRVACLADAEIEIFVSDIRRYLLLSGVKGQTIKTDYLDLTVSIALQNHITEYVHYVSVQEHRVVATLGDELEKLLQEKDFVLGPPGAPSIAQSFEKTCAILLLLSLYQPLIHWDQENRLSRIDRNSWPQYLQEILAATLFEPLDELARLDKIETLGPVSDAVSQEIKQQYEENPYPRWTKLRYEVEPAPYIYCNKYLQTNFVAPPYMAGGALKILVAGCGTGQQPISLAKSCLNARITALDLSVRSLAYGQRMAEKYQLENIRFMQGDILQLQQWQEKFHIIECSGVLMYLQDPAQGLGFLRALLPAGGLIRLGLYSEIARKTITQIRHDYADIRRDPSLENIRQFRHDFIFGKNALKNKEQNKEQQKKLLDIVDFYTASGCRDLLFSWQEHRFTLPEIKKMLQQNQLKFIGFQLKNPQIEKDYLAMFPADIHLNNLDYWHVFEQRYPDTFKHMYNFHCQAISLSSHGIEVPI